MPRRNKIVITIEDGEDGFCRVQCTPNLIEMVTMTQRGPEATSMAVAYAMAALRKIAEDSKTLKGRERKSQLILPPGYEGIVQ